jgi:hypothetical protein
LSSLQEGDRAAAAVAKAPRISLADLEANILARYDFNAGEMVRGWLGHSGQHPNVGGLSICILVTRNGFSVVGKSAPASMGNFNRELGRKLAYEDAVRQLWPLMGYALRVQLDAEDAERHKG